MKINTRLNVELVKGYAGNCYTVHTLHIKSLFNRDDATLIKLANLAGFSGQGERVVRRWTEKAEDNDCNFFQCAEVVIECDSGD
jgi:hypothetical protein